MKGQGKHNKDYSKQCHALFLARHHDQFDYSRLQRLVGTFLHHGPDRIKKKNQELRGSNVIK